MPVNSLKDAPKLLETDMLGTKSEGDCSGEKLV